MSRRELPGIDAIRIAACLVIAAYHARGSGLASEYLPALNWVAGPRGFGPNVTSLFLALSGFVLFYANANRATDIALRPRGFWRARAARLVPLTLVGHVLAAPVALSGASRYAADEAVVRAGLALTMTQAWYPRLAMSYASPAWTMSVLAFGYLLFPRLAASALRLSAARTAAVLAATWSLSVAASIAVLRMPDAAWVHEFAGRRLDIAHVFPPIRVLEFASGVLLGRLWLARADSRFGAIFVAAMAAPLLGVLLFSHLLPPDPAVVLGYAALLPISWAVIWIVADRETSSARVMSWARLLGRSSFAVYVLHDPLLAIVKGLLHRGWFADYGAVLLVVWFVSLVPVGLAAERWFVAPIARRLLPARGEDAGRAAARHRMHDVPGGTRPGTAWQSRVGAGER